MHTTMPLAFRVREIREALGISQAELARRADIRPSTLSAIETNKTKGIDLTTLEAIANALDVDPSILIVREKSSRSKS